MKRGCLLNVQGGRTASDLQGQRVESIHPRSGFTSSQCKFGVALAHQFLTVFLFPTPLYFPSHPGSLPTADTTFVRKRIKVHDCPMSTRSSRSYCTVLTARSSGKLIGRRSTFVFKHTLSLVLFLAAKPPFCDVPRPLRWHPHPLVHL